MGLRYLCSLLRVGGALSGQTTAYTTCTHPTDCLLHLYLLLQTSFHILIVLSASPVVNLLPDKSKADAKIPRSLSREPGCATVCNV
jgi:hypothetical protein